MLSTREMGQDAKAEITREMLEGMLSDFDRMSDSDGVLTIELRGNGLSALNPATGTYEVVGLARMSPAIAIFARAASARAISRCPGCITAGASFSWSVPTDCRHA